MEEEEERKKEVVTISSKDSDNHEVDGSVEEKNDPSRQETFNNADSDVADVKQNSLTSQVVDSVTTVVDEDHFEQVSLKDQDKIVGAIQDVHADSNGSSVSDIARLSSGQFEDASQSFTAELNSSVVDEMRYDQLFSCYFTSKTKGQTCYAKCISRVIAFSGSAIMGKHESLDKLKNIVSGVESFGSGDEMDSIACLVVDSLIATMGGVESFEEDDNKNPPSVMLNSRAAIVSGELIPSLPWVGDSDVIMSPRTRMVRGLLAIIRACTRNRAMCSMAGLLGVLLSTLATLWATRLMIALEKAMGGKESRGPASTFEFDGESSGLLGPGENRWAFTIGYAFSTWIYIESFADTLNAATAAAAIAATAAAKSGKSSAMSAAAAASALAGEGTAHMPRLFSFLSADNQGFEAYFHAQFLVVESGSGKGKKTSLHFTHAFKPQCWYFIGLEHTCKQGMLGKAESELRLYIDGSLYETRPFEFPRIFKPLAFCCIGTNPPPTMAYNVVTGNALCLLRWGLFIFLRNQLARKKMSRLASRGGDVLPSFGHGAGLLLVMGQGCHG
ncbi:hypothetical protein ACFX13_002442 [Malus domestica]